jgi:hypothetical protein
MAISNSAAPPERRARQG